MPKREIEIGKRLHTIRITFGLSRVGLARVLQIDSSRLATYEAGRVPIRYELAEEVCQVFNINQIWLATGKLKMVPHIDISQSFSAKIPQRMLFSEAYERFIMPAIPEMVWVFSRAIERDKDLKVEMPWGWIPPLGMSVEKQKIWNFQKEIERMERGIPESSRVQFWTALFEAGIDFVIKPPEQINSPKPEDQVVEKIRREMKGLEVSNAVLTWGQGEIGKKSKLTVDTPKEFCQYSLPMTPRTPVQSLEDLIERLCRATATPGAKSQLAREFGVTRQAVNRWLNGKSAPSADTALRLSNWVETKESVANEKPLGSSTKTAKGKTQKGESNEPHKSGRQKP